MRLGDLGAPPTSTNDPDLLRWAAAEHRAVITYNRKTMKTHVEDLAVTGNLHHWGVFGVRPFTAVAVLVDHIHLRWGAREAEEWRLD